MFWRGDRDHDTRAVMGLRWEVQHGVGVRTQEWGTGGS